MSTPVLITLIICITLIILSVLNVVNTHIKKPKSLSDILGINTNNTKYKNKEDNK